jgi:hypothetical protein
MSPLWSDMALARAALAQVEERDSVTHFAKPKPRSGANDQRVRRLPYPARTSFAL